MTRSRLNAGKALSVFASLSLMVTAPAVAAPKIVVQPVQVGQETVRYQQGVGTLELERDRGIVQITLLPMDHGSLSFSIAVLNKGTQPSNIDIDSVQAHAGPQALPVLSKDMLLDKAKNRAMWTQVALALAGGVAAGLSASQRDTYRSTWITPRGTYRATYSGPSAAGQVGAGVIVAGTAVAIGSVQQQLDATRAALGDSIVQLTTVDPGESYAGQIILTKIKSTKLPQRVDMVITWNGEDYPFALQVAPAGTKTPVFTTVPRPLAPPPSPVEAMPAAASPAAPASAPAAVEPAAASQGTTPA